MPGANRAARRQRHKLRAVTQKKQLHQNMAELRYVYETIVARQAEQIKALQAEVLRLRVLIGPLAHENVDSSALATLPPLATD